MSDEYESRVHRATWLNHAGNDLLPAVGPVRQGRQHVSSGLLGHHFIEATDVQTTNRLWQQYEKMPNHWKTSV